MHSTIFQITKTRVEKENYLNEDTLMQGDNSHFDYCAEMDDEVRKEEIDYLVNHILPERQARRYGFRRYRPWCRGGCQGRSQGLSEDPYCKTFSKCN